MGWDPLQPVPQGRNLVALEQLGADFFQHLDDVVPLATGGRVANGILEKAIRLQPGRGALVETGDLLLTDGAAQLLAQGVGEEVVIAIPRALSGQGQDEQVVAFAATQHLIAIAGLGDRVAQAGVEPIQDRGAQEERADILRLALEDFFPEILVAQLDAAHELLNELHRLVAGPPMQRRADQLEADHPPLGPLVNHLDLAGGEIEVEIVVEVLQRLLQRELQVALRDQQRARRWSGGAPSAAAGSCG